MKLKLKTGLILLLFSPLASATWLTSGWVDANNLIVHMDNGKTYFTGFSTQGTCQYNRLELRETGGYYGNLENSKRMFSLILASKAQGKRIKLGYEDGDGPECRLAQVYVE